VVFGGGMSYLLPDSLPQGKRRDGENLQDVLGSRGYKVISKRSELKDLSSDTKKVWGLFSNSHLCHDINRPYFGKEQPSLAEMTSAAISILSRNPKGFFLLVEGSQVDFTSHNNDPVGVITEYLAFDSAVGVALDFARKNKNTIVMVFPDHDNGGLSLGLRGDKYTDMPVSNIIPHLKKARITASGLLDTLIRSQKLVSVDFVSKALKEFMGIDALDAQDSLDVKEIISVVKNGKYSDPDVAKVGSIISRRASIGWTTHGHCGTNVWIYGLGVDFDSIIDNTDIARICFKNLGYHPIPSAAYCFRMSKSYSENSKISLSLLIPQSSGKQKEVYPWRFPVKLRFFRSLKTRYTSVMVKSCRWKESRFTRRNPVKFIFPCRL
jgi:alkaline phosphatase